MRISSEARKMTLDKLKAQDRLDIWSKREWRKCWSNDKVEDDIEDLEVYIDECIQKVIDLHPVKKIYKNVVLEDPSLH